MNEMNHDFSQHKQWSNLGIWQIMVAASRLLQYLIKNNPKNYICKYKLKSCRPQSFIFLKYYPDISNIFKEFKYHICS